MLTGLEVAGWGSVLGDKMAHLCSHICALLYPPESSESPVVFVAAGTIPGWPVSSSLPRSQAAR